MFTPDPNKGRKLAPEWTAGMCGRLAYHVYDSLCKLPAGRAAGFPTREQLAKVLGTTPYGLGGLVSGKGKGKGKDIESARKLVAYLTTGSISHDDLKGTAKEIDQYFFREFKSNGPSPAYFSGRRQQFGGPMSRTEIVGECAWFARHKKLHPADRVRLVWVIGCGVLDDDKSLSEDKSYAEAVEACLDAQVEVTLVYSTHRPRWLASVDTVGSLKRFANGGKTRPLTKVELPGKAPLDGWHSFVTPVFQYLFMATPSEEILYVIRGKETNDEREHDPTPFAFHAHTSELEAFELWLAAVTPASA